MCMYRFYNYKHTNCYSRTLFYVFSSIAFGYELNRRMKFA